LGQSAKHLVIVVDDDSKIRESLESLLKAAEFTVGVFSSAEEVLQSDILARASCLITDVRMPGIHGPELQHLIKRDYPKLPVIFITGHRDEHIKQNAFSDGASFFFYKPFDPKTLLRAIHIGIFGSAQGA
jgi:FixJ family two-component response regulator